MAGGKLTTHVLDTMSGRPGAGLWIDLYRIDGDERRLATRARTNADGRCDAPLLQGEGLTPGVYELVFHVGDYFAAAGVSGARFLDTVPVRFAVTAPDQHYHVPLLVTPYAYSTYRGS